MKKIVKRVLGIGMLAGLLFVSLGNVDAVDRYDCSRFDDKPGQCKLSNKCEPNNKDEKPGVVTIEPGSTGYCIPKNEKKADIKTQQYEDDAACEKFDDSSLRKECRDAARKNAAAALKCDAKMDGRDKPNKVDPSRTNGEICNAAKTETDCRKYFPASGGITGKLDKCLDRLRKLDKAKGKIQIESEAYDPFGSYSGPSFSGPGLKAGSAIAKTKIDNSISKEKSIQKLAIGWVNFALSIIAVVAVIAIIYAGMLYMTSMGDDGNKDKAKDIIMYVAIGVLLIYGSYAIVNALLSADAGGVKVSILDVLLTV